ncbi:MAG: membrane dipeptidase [Erysipelotrichaceae bacterium]|nr:membrane dipeptidase [Erysipelotrichaceae bacterium]
MSLLANRLKEEGFDDEKIAKIFYKNVLRVLENVLK